LPQSRRQARNGKRQNVYFVQVVTSNRGGVLAIKNSRRQTDGRDHRNRVWWGVGVGVGIGGVIGISARDASRVPSNVAKVIIGNSSDSETNDINATFWELFIAFQWGSWERNLLNHPGIAKLVKAIINIFWPLAKIPYEIPRVWFINRWVEILGLVVLIDLFRKKPAVINSKIDGKLLRLVIAFLFGRLYHRFLELISQKVSGVITIAETVYLPCRTWWDCFFLRLCFGSHHGKNFSPK